MFILNRNNHRPLHETLYLEIKNQIVEGALSPNTRLLSVRQLAAELAVSRNTVEYAYEQLCTEGYLYSKPRSGYYVSLLEQEFAARTVDNTKFSGHSFVEKSYSYDFHPAAISPDDFPDKIWRRLLLDSVKTYREQLSVYGNPQGESGLRVEIQRYLARYRGVGCNAEQIVICAGLQDSLSIIAQLLQESHSNLAVEDPGHWIPRAVFQRYSFSVSSIPVNEEGMNIEYLKKTKSTIAYVTPSHQFPLGYVMPVDRRLQLLHWAEAGGVIIEDDYDSELRYHGKPIPALQGLHPSADIFYIGTFSKVLSPALRVSYMIVPNRFLSAYYRLFGNYAPTVSLLEQKTICEFMRQGYWERHLRKMRTNFKRKHDSLLQAVYKHFGDQVTVSGQGAGLHIVVEFANMALTEAERLHRAFERQVRVFPMTGMYQETRPLSTQVMLGFGRMDVEKIEKGIEVLAEAWQSE